MKPFLLALVIAAGLVATIPYFFPPICAPIGGGCSR